MSKKKAWNRCLWIYHTPWAQDKSWILSTPAADVDTLTLCQLVELPYPSRLCPDVGIYAPPLPLSWVRGETFDYVAPYPPFLLFLLIQTQLFLFAPHFRVSLNWPEDSCCWHFSHLKKGGKVMSNQGRRSIVHWWQWACNSRSEMAI